MKINVAVDMQSYLDICIASQQLTVYADGKQVLCYPVSTAKKGAGERMGSECTPTGWHKIRAKIGAGQPLNSVFVGRRATGEIYSCRFGRTAPATRLDIDPDIVVGRAGAGQESLRQRRYRLAIYLYPRVSRSINGRQPRVARLYSDEECRCAGFV